MLVKVGVRALSVLHEVPKFGKPNYETASTRYEILKNASWCEQGRRLEIPTSMVAMETLRSVRRLEQRDFT